MFLRRCRLLLKRIYSSFVMFREDQLAAAQLAQIFGSELLKVQNSAQTDSGTTPDIVKLNPKQFLVGSDSLSNQRKEEERRLIMALQREAEASHPLPPEQFHNPPSQQTLVHVAPEPTRNRSVTPVNVSNETDVLERIALSLERIANSIGTVDVQVKKKKLRRKTNSSKAVILNETIA